MITIKSKTSLDNIFSRALNNAVCFNGVKNETRV